MRKLTAFLLAFTICLGTLKSNADIMNHLTDMVNSMTYRSLTSTQTAEQSFIASSENVKLIGRTYLMNKTLWLAYSGTGIEFKFTGTKAEITFIGDNIAACPEDNGKYCRIGIYVNGRFLKDELLNKQQKTITAFQSRNVQTVTITVLKLSEASQSTVGIAPIKVMSVGRIEPSPAKPHRIEFIGDSITCGYGVEASNQHDKFTTSTENFAKTYAYKTAMLLDADYSVVSSSGYGILSGHTSDPDIIDKKRLIPDIYDTLGRSGGYFNSKIKVESLAWNFSKFRPELIVINLGTNDASYCKSDQEKLNAFTESYVQFLKTVRANNPDATILCTYGMMGGKMFPYIEAAAKQYTKETGDSNLWTQELDPPAPNDGYGASWHPSDKTHTKAADKLVERIRAIMKW